MRFATSMLNRTMLTSMNRQNERIFNLQTQLSTGQKFHTATDNPIDFASTLDLDHAQKRVDQYKRNIDSLTQRMGLQESTMGSITDNVKRIRELSIQAGNPSYDMTNRKAISTELRERMREIVDLGNTQDANGEYIFAGFTSDDTPFSMNQVGDLFHVEYNGTDHSREIQVSESRTMPVGLVGKDVFFDISGENSVRTDAAQANTGSAAFSTAFVDDDTAYIADDYTLTFTSPTSLSITDGAGGAVGTYPYTSGEIIEFNGLKMSFTGNPDVSDSFSVRTSQYQDIFTTVNQLTEALEDPSQPAASLAIDLSKSLGHVTEALDHVVDQRAQIGSRLKALESHQETNEELSFQIQSRYSKLNDTDFAEAASDLAQQTAILQAAQLTFSKVQNLSLFNYIQ